MRYLLIAAPLIVPALGAAVATIDGSLEELLRGLVGSEESYAVHHHRGESFLTARVPCNGCRAFAGSRDENGLKYIPKMSLETDLIFDIRIPSDEPTALKINDAGVIPFGPNFILTAYQIPRQTATEQFLFTTPESDWKSLPLGFDLMLQSSMESPESAKKEVTVNFRITSVASERNDAIPELEIVVDEELATKNLAMKSVSVKQLAGAPLVWLDELENPKDLLPLFDIPPLEETAPVDVALEIEMKQVPCGTNFSCVLEHAIDNLRKLKDSAFGTKAPPPHHMHNRPCNHHNQGQPEADPEILSALPIDLDALNFPDYADIPHYEDFGTLRPLLPGEAKESSSGFGLLGVLGKIPFLIFTGVATVVAAYLFGAILGLLFRMGLERIQASKKARRHHKGCNNSGEARAMLTIEEEEELPGYRDEGIEVAEKE